MPQNATKTFEKLTKKLSVFNALRYFFNLQLSNSRELEVELYSGDEEDMKALGALIADKYGLISEDKSKYKRGLELLQQK